MSLDRFREIQVRSSVGYDVALAELKKGRKESHWIWYIFPQLEGLGQSAMAYHYGIRGLDEACDYLRDDVLRTRLIEVTRAVAGQVAKKVPLLQLMGGETDTLKLVSSLTLFEVATDRIPNWPFDPELSELDVLCARVLSAAAREGYPRCRYTLEKTRIVRK